MRYLKLINRSYAHFGRHSNRYVNLDHVIGMELFWYDKCTPTDEYLNNLRDLKIISDATYKRYIIQLTTEYVTHLDVLNMIIHHASPIHSTDLDKPYTATICPLLPETDEPLHWATQYEGEHDDKIFEYVSNAEKIIDEILTGERTELETAYWDVK